MIAMLENDSAMADLRVPIWHAMSVNFGATALMLKDNSMTSEDMVLSYSSS